MNTVIEKFCNTFRGQSFGIELKAPRSYTVIARIYLLGYYKNRVCLPSVRTSTLAFFIQFYGGAKRIEMYCVRQSGFMSASLLLRFVETRNSNGGEKKVEKDTIIMAVVTRRNYIR